MPVSVLTGDIVGSTSLSYAEMEQVRAIMRETSRDLQSDLGFAHFDAYRGDGWQATFTQPRTALRIALNFRAALRSVSSKFETRIALAIGSETLGDPTVKSASSATFIASGRALDAMNKDHFFAHASGGALQAATVLADHISRRWTPAQARAIGPFLHPSLNRTQKEVADILGITRQAVGQALDAAGFAAIDAALMAIETIKTAKQVK